MKQSQPLLDLGTPPPSRRRRSFWCYGHHRQALVMASLGFAWLAHDIPSHGSPSKKKPVAAAQAKRASQSEPIVSPEQLSALVKANEDLTAGRTSKAVEAIRSLSRLDWPGPFAEIMDTHVLAALALMPEADFGPRWKGSEPASRLAAANSLNLSLPPAATTLPEANGVLPTVIPPAPPTPQIAAGGAPERLSSANKPSELAALKAAWTSGKVGEARQLALKARKNRHGRSCNGTWAYAQFVLARLARGAQNREGFLRYQKLLVDQLLGSFCDASRFEMTEAGYRAFRWDNVLWSARLNWEFERLAKADKLASIVLREAMAAGDHDTILEAVQVLHGRVRYEDTPPPTARSQLAALRDELAASKQLAPDLAEFIAFRSGLLAWEDKDYTACIDELRVSSVVLRAALEKSDTPPLRRDYTKHLYWMARCASSASGKAEPGQRETFQTLVKEAWDDIHRLTATGYYAMLMQQEHGDLGNDKEGTAGKATTKVGTGAGAALPPTPPKWPDKMRALKTTASLILGSPSFMRAPRTSFLWRRTADWTLAALRDQETQLFFADAGTLARSWDVLLAAQRAEDVILGAGRVAQDIRLDRPEADLVLAYLYPPSYLDTLTKAATACNVDRVVLYSVARQESLFNPRAVSPAGAQGLLQVMPSVWRDLKRERKDWNLGSDPFVPQENALVGACHLRGSLDRFEGNTALALAAYNAGEQQVARWYKRRWRGDLKLFVENIPFGETQNYVKQITRSIYHAPRIWQSSRAWAEMVRPEQGL